jgi:hypothetical protein
MPNTPKDAKYNLEARIEQIRVLRDESKLPKSTKETPLALP